MNEQEALKYLSEQLYCFFHAVGIEKYNNGGILHNLSWIQAVSKIEIDHAVELELDVQEFRVYCINLIKIKIKDAWRQLTYATGHRVEGELQVEYIYEKLIQPHLNGKKLIFTINASIDQLELTNIQDEINPHEGSQIDIPQIISLANN